MPGIGSAVLGRIVVRLVLTCLLVLGVLGMHGLVSVGDHHALPGTLGTEPVGPQVDEAPHAPEGTDGHSAVHLAEVACGCWSPESAPSDSHLSPGASSVCG